MDSMCCKKIVKILSVFPLMLNGYGTVYAQSILPFFSQAPSKHSHKIPPPPKLADVQIRNYTNINNGILTMETTAAEDLGYGYEESRDNHEKEKEKEKEKINQSLINVKSSAIEELLDKEEALKIHIDRKNVINHLDGIDVHKQGGVPSGMSVQKGDDVALAHYLQQAMNSSLNSIPLQVVTIEKDVVNFEIQSLEKQVMNQLSSTALLSKTINAKNNNDIKKIIKPAIVEIKRGIKPKKKSPSKPYRRPIKPVIKSTPSTIKDAPKNTIQNTVVNHESIHQKISRSLQNSFKRPPL